MQPHERSWPVLLEVRLRAPTPFSAHKGPGRLAQNRRSSGAPPRVPPTPQPPIPAPALKKLPAIIRDLVLHPDYGLDADGIVRLLCNVFCVSPPMALHLLSMPGLAGPDWFMGVISDNGSADGYLLEIYSAMLKLWPAGGRPPRVDARSHCIQVLPSRCLLHRQGLDPERNFICACPGRATCSGD
ncbi:hypothetical protein BC828DRAFT_271847 [Blastocladiella britannica]|nr:hypothetical protein BC828DRAFT_271847 [Blastocladiella britannica]